MHKAFDNGWFGRDNVYGFATASTREIVSVTWAEEEGLGEDEVEEEGKEEMHWSTDDRRDSSRGEETQTLNTSFLCEKKELDPNHPWRGNSQLVQ